MVITEEFLAFLSFRDMTFYEIYMTELNKTTEYVTLRNEQELKNQMRAVLV
jgi:hypothetical protein